MSSHLTMESLRLLGTRWLITRNPTYLLSACTMAIGARLYLVQPRTRAGEAGLILLTLSILLLYKWAVSAILLMLHHRSRAPEDEHSLLLVLALFWTGPLAATTEMAVHRPYAGTLLAVATAILAISEILLLHRSLKLSFCRSTLLFVGGCVAILAIVPPLLRPREPITHLNELSLYITWWILAGLTLLTVQTLRQRHAGRSNSAGSTRMCARVNCEQMFILITLAATCAHLAGMNYAFFTNARLFYCSPLILAISVVTMQWVEMHTRHGRRSLLFAGSLPVLAILLARQSFHPSVPVAGLLPALQHPMTAILGCAAVVWGYAYHRYHERTFLHAGVLALSAFLFRVYNSTAETLPTARHVMDAPVEITTELVAIGLYALAVYFFVVALMLRSRNEGVIGLKLQLLATALLAHDHQAAGLIIGLATGWTLIIAIHILQPEAKGRYLALPILLLLAITWQFDFVEGLSYYARAHATWMTCAVIVVAVCWPTSAYRWISILTAAAHFVFYVGRTISLSNLPWATAAVAASFSLLGAGLAISWYKPILLKLLKRTQPEPIGTELHAENAIQPPATLNSSQEGA